MVLVGGSVLFLFCPHEELLSFCLQKPLALQREHRALKNMNTLLLVYRFLFIFRRFLKFCDSLALVPASTVFAPETIFKRKHTVPTNGAYCTDNLRGYPVGTGTVLKFCVLDVDSSLHDESNWWSVSWLWAQSAPRTTVSGTCSPAYFLPFFLSDLDVLFLLFKFVSLIFKLFSAPSFCAWGTVPRYRTVNCRAWYRGNLPFCILSYKKLFRNDPVKAGLFLDFRVTGLFYLTMQQRISSIKTATALQWCTKHSPRQLGIDWSFSLSQAGRGRRRRARIRRYQYTEERRATSPFRQVPPSPLVR
jgi:hypothetical protein